MKTNKINVTLASVLMGLMAVSALTSCGPKTENNYKTYTNEELLDLTVRVADGSNGVVAAANPFAANAGLKVLQAGGNAFDAAVAVSFALGVCEPHASGIGGGGILVGYEAATGEYVSYNFREFVPERGTASAYSGDQIDGVKEWAEGLRSIGVPTHVASMLKIIERHGNFENTPAGRESVIGPARDLAKNGFTITKELADAFSGEDCWKTTQEGRDIFGINGKRSPKQEGDTIVNATLANTYDKIITLGNDGFYKGDVAKAILDIAGLESEENHWGHKGLITQEDLDYAVANYPLVLTPTQGTYNGYDIVSSAPPSSGGIILVEALNMLETYEQKYGKLTDLGHNSPEYINVLSTASQLAYGDKQKWIGDDKFVNVPKKGLVSKKYAAARFMENYTVGQQYNGKYSQVVTKAEGVMESIPGSTTASYSSLKGGTVSGQNYGRADWYDPDFKTYKNNLDMGVQTNDLENVQTPTDVDEHKSTTAFSVADKYGNIVSITQTINHFFGAKMMPVGTGFYLNNQLSSFSLTSTSASYMQPFKNPTSHIMPTIMLKDGNPVATLGSPGSMRLVSAVFETIVNMVNWTFDVNTQTWLPRDEEVTPDLQIQPAIEGARLYSYCVSTSDCGEGKMDETKHKPLYLEVEVANPSTKGTIVQHSDITDETVRILEEDYGYQVVKYEGRKLFFGGVQGITFDSLGRMHGGADIRRDGKALGY